MICRSVFDRHAENWRLSPLLGVIFVLAAALLALAVLVVGAVRGTYSVNILNPGRPFASVLPVLPALFAAVFVLGTLFQFLYSLGADSGFPEVDSYIFLMDNSGSMDSNDPDRQRYRAIESVMRAKDAGFPYMVYGFADSSELIRAMSPKSEGSDFSGVAQGGGTLMFHALERILDEAGTEWNGAEQPRVIVMTDGSTADGSGSQALLRRYKQSGVSISTIGLGQVDESLLERVANYTGGVYCHISDLDSLPGAMEEAALKNASWHLLSYRYTNRLYALRAVMRVVFLLLLGCAVRLAAILAYGRDEALSWMLPLSAAQAFAAALLAEWGLNAALLSERFVWLLYWELLCLSVTTEPAYSFSPAIGAGASVAGASTPAGRGWIQ